jgi:hypothetical protein
VQIWNNGRSFCSKNVNLDFRKGILKLRKITLKDFGKIKFKKRKEVEQNNQS